MEPLIQIICFSRNRPLQLHGYLESLFRMLDDPSAVLVKVLVKSDPEYLPAYRMVADAFKQVRMVYERSFASDLLGLIGNHPYTCFGCDDVVFVRKVNARHAVDLIADDTLSFSLRLGRNITRSMFSAHAVPQPAFITNDDVLAWECDPHYSAGANDWMYAWELNGTVYRTETARRIVEAANSSSPNTLESAGSILWKSITQHRVMKSWSLPCLIVPTINVVQRDFPPVVYGETRSTEWLLERYKSGARMDVDKFAQHTYDSIHVGDFFLRAEP